METSVALITGGAGDIGLACARALSIAGSSIALADRSGSSLETAAASLGAEGVQTTHHTVDVTSEDDVRRMLDEVVLGHGQAPTILLNAAGVLEPTRVLEISSGEWDRVVNVTLRGTFLCSRACLPAMIDAGWGRIVNFSSTAGKSVSTLGGVHYTTAKAGVLGLTRGTAKEVAEHGVRVNAVCPGLIDTGMVRQLCDVDRIEAYADSFPIRRLGRPWEVAALVAFLCGDSADYITGAAFDINGGDLMV